MQPSPCCFESKNRGAEGDKRVQGGSADSWSFGISDRNIASTSGTCNHLTLGSRPGKFRAAPTALCSQWLWMIPSSGELTIKLNNSCPYCWLRHFLGKKKLFCVQKRSLLPENLLFWAESTEVVKNAWKLLSEFSAGDILGSFWLIWKQQRETNLKLHHRNKILQGLFCWQIHFKILQILAVSHHSPKAQKSRCPEVAKAARWLPHTTGSPDVLCRQPKNCCSVLGQRKELGIWHSFRNYFPHKCILWFFFSPKTELFENKGFKISRQRWVCGHPLFQQSPWLVALQCQQSWSISWKDPVFSWLSGPNAINSS